MSENFPLDEHVEQMGKASFRSAIISLLGFLLILAAMGYAAVQLHNSEKQLNDTQTQLTQTQKDLNQARLAVAESLKEVAATRDEKAAIDAFHALHWDEAVSLFDRALATDPGNVYVEDMRAYMLFRLGKINEALAQERQAIASDPNYATSYLNLARFQCAATPSQMDEARKNTEKFKAMRPDMSTFPKMDGEFQRVCKGQIQ